jgi:hypothetical protein
VISYGGRSFEPSNDLAGRRCFVTFLSLIPGTNPRHSSECDCNASGLVTHELIINAEPCWRRRKHHGDRS